MSNSAEKKALLLFWHGIGDLICLTPALRELHNRGYHCDILCLPYLLTCGVLADCSYVTLLPLPTDVSPSDGGKRGAEARKICVETWEKKKTDYDDSFHFGQRPDHVRGGKIARNLKACGLPTDIDSSMALFISPEAEKEAKAFIKENYPEGFIFCHTESERHPYHNWDAKDVLSSLPDIPVFSPDEYRWSNINVAFVMAREAKHRVLISSVFVHACDAMGAVMDVVHYGVPNPHGLPIDESIIKEVSGVRYNA